MPETLREAFDFLVETAYLAGRKTLAHFQTGVQADYKADRSPVTQADKAAEELIRARIEARYPGHAIIGEEFGRKESAGASHCWIVDPIDGTKSFLRGIPLYAVLIGLEIDGQVAAGAAYFPALDEMLAAADGLGCWWNGRPARVSSVPRLDQAWVTSSDPLSFDHTGKRAAWERLKRAAYSRGGWGDAYGYLLVATGRAEVMLDPIMEVWDCGPFPPILREAGGYFGDWQGTPTIYAREALATSQALLPEVLATLKGGE
ncbi:MAG TPA: inositol monophosphatase family protein [Anaerolinea sp.]|nr:inositol monophosphatase family protein [Anaerolinea sp.]